MKLFRQSKNDCLRTCIACLIEVPPEEIVDFKEHYSDGDDEEGVPFWHKLLEEDLNSRGFTRDLATDEEIREGKFVIAVGPSSNTGIMHAEIYKNGELFYDPSGEGTPLKEVLVYQIIRPYERKTDINV